MKLKGLGNRAYNVLFHTHTVAGIVISFALFVIFYAGSFALFRHEIAQWENPEARQPMAQNFNYELALQKVDSVYGLDYTQLTNIIYPADGSPFFKVFGAYNTSDSTTERMAAYVAPNYRVQDMRQPVTTVSDTLYYLHYFRQIPVVGMYIAGLVSLFFLFAIITGLLIHWRNLFTKFFAFVIEGKWKNIWTNTHTVLGVIGLPFQIMYAITGSFFALLTIILLPSVVILYEGDSTKIFNKVTPENTIELDPAAPLAQNKSLAELKAQVEAAYPNLHVSRASIRNYGMADALITWRIHDHKGIRSSGSITMYMKDGIELKDVSIPPVNKNYSQSVIEMISRLHFAEYGGYVLKATYFIMAMITALMIMAGVLIWRKARNNNSYTYKQRLFHHKVTKVYLAICLSMFPAFAVIFLANKLIPMSLTGRVTWVNGIFFISWLALTIIGLFWNNYAKQNRNYLGIGGVLALTIPIINGVVTGHWFWLVIDTLPFVASVDLFWLGAGITALYLAYKVLKVPAQSDKPLATAPDQPSEEAPLPQTGKAAKPKIPQPQMAMNNTTLPHGGRA